MFYYLDSRFRVREDNPNISSITYSNRTLQEVPEDAFSSGFPINFFTSDSTTFSAKVVGGNEKKLFLDSIPSTNNHPVVGKQLLTNDKQWSVVKKYDPHGKSIEVDPPLKNIVNGVSTIELSETTPSGNDRSLYFDTGDENMMLQPTLYNDQFVLNHDTLEFVQIKEHDAEKYQLLLKSAFSKQKPSQTKYQIQKQKGTYVSDTPVISLSDPSVITFDYPHEDLRKVDLSKNFYYIQVVHQKTSTIHRLKERVSSTTQQVTCGIVPPLLQIGTPSINRYKFYQILQYSGNNFKNLSVINNSQYMGRLGCLKLVNFILPNVTLVNRKKVSDYPFIGLFLRQPGVNSGVEQKLITNSSKIQHMSYLLPIVGVTSNNNVLFDINENNYIMWYLKDGDITVEIRDPNGDLLPFPNDWLSPQPPHPVTQYMLVLQWGL